jgi:hypothetical protein
VQDAGEKPLVLSLSHVEAVSSSFIGEESQRQYDDTLAADEGDKVTPHVEAVRYMIEILHKGDTCSGEAAHHVEDAVEIRAEVP